MRIQSLKSYTRKKEKINWPKLPKLPKWPKGPEWPMWPKGLKWTQGLKWTKGHKGPKWINTMKRNMRTDL